MSGAGNIHSVVVHPTKINPLHHDSFQEALREWFRSAPWLLLSCLLHLMVGLLFANMDWLTTRVDDFQNLDMAFYDPNEIDLPDLEPPEKLEKQVEALEDKLPDPDLDVVDPPLDEQIIDDTQMDPIDTNSRFVDLPIGTGGGFPVGGKYGRRLQRKGRCPVAAQHAVDDGLSWLARHQDPEGFWDCDGFNLHCKRGRCNGRGSALHDPGVTGLALLAFLGAGHTPRMGRYKDTVRKGIRYLCDIQDPEDGCLTPKEGDQYMYNHAIACLALTEAYGLSKWITLKKPAQRAIDYIHHAKNPGKAWRYNIGEEDPLKQNDVSITGWMIMCLASAHDFELSVDLNDLEDALGYLDEMTDSSTGRTGYIEPGCWSARESGDELVWPYDAGEAMTGVAVFSRVLCGTALGKIEEQAPMLEKGARLLTSKPPRWDENAGTIDFYYWYYGSYAMYQLAGNYWKIWKEEMVRAVLNHQIREGCEKGSWDPTLDPWGDQGGRIYSTALLVLCLEAFYRYDYILGQDRLK